MNSVIPEPINFSRLRALSTPSLNGDNSRCLSVANSDHFEFRKDNSASLDTPLHVVKTTPFAFTTPNKSYAKRADRLSIYLMGIAVIVVIGIFCLVSIPSDETLSFFKTKNDHSIDQPNSKSSSDALQETLLSTQAESLQKKMNMVKIQYLESESIPAQKLSAENKP